MIIHDVIQGTDAWRLARSGKFTASNFDKLFMGKTTAGYQNLVNTVIFERITGSVAPSYSNDTMRRGNELEAEALQRYELETFSKTEKIGFAEYNEWIGASPDALAGDEGLVQAKCPLHNTFIYYLLFPNKAKEEYLYQCQGELFVTERAWNDLFIYHPMLSPITIRIDRDEEIISKIQKELAIAIKLADERINIIKGTKQ